jgi:hypothetical protein
MRPVGHAVLDIDIPAFDESTVEIQIDAARTPNTPSRLALAGQPLFRQLGGSRAGQCREGGSKNKGNELRSHGALPQGCRRTHEPRAVIIARRLAVERLFFTRFDSGAFFLDPRRGLAMAPTGVGRALVVACRYMGVGFRASFSRHPTATGLHAFPSPHDRRVGANRSP